MSSTSTPKSDQIYGFDANAVCSFVNFPIDSTVRIEFKSCSRFSISNRDARVQCCSGIIFAVSPSSICCCDVVSICETEPPRKLFKYFAISMASTRCFAASWPRRANFDMEKAITAAGLFSYRVYWIFGRKWLFGRFGSTTKFRHWQLNWQT